MDECFSCGACVGAEGQQDIQPRTFCRREDRVVTVCPGCFDALTLTGEGRPIAEHEERLLLTLAELNDSGMAPGWGQDQAHIRRGTWLLVERSLHGGGYWATTHHSPQTASAYIAQQPEGIWDTVALTDLMTGSHWEQRVEVSWVRK